MMCLEQVLKYANVHNMKFNEITFRHCYNGKKFVVVDSDLGLFKIEGTDSLKTLKDLEYDYENEDLFCICD